MIAVIIFALFSFGIINTTSGSRDEQTNMSLNRNIAQCETSEIGSWFHDWCWEHLQERRDKVCAENSNYDICSYRGGWLH